MPPNKDEKTPPSAPPESMEDVSEGMNAKLQQLEDEAQALQAALDEAEKKSDDLRRRLLNDAAKG